MKKLSFVIILFLSFTISNAQVITPKTNFLLKPSNYIVQAVEYKTKTIYLEIAGAAGIGSINYESQFNFTIKNKWAYRIGLGGFPGDQNTGTTFIIPIGLHYISNIAKAHNIDMSLGHNISITTKGQFHPQLTVSAGYRFEKLNSPLFLRLSYTPLISYLYDLQYQHWAGLSIGYRF